MHVCVRSIPVIEKAGISNLALLTNVNFKLKLDYQSVLEMSYETRENRY